MITYTHDTVPTEFVEANGIRFAYRRFGATSGVPLVFFQHFGLLPALHGKPRRPRPGADRRVRRPTSSWAVNHEDPRGTGDVGAH
jgi:hypothetical protein